jgi:coproporphyrinogen III oxidase
MTREEWIEIHKKNVKWINEQIRICLMARRLLKGIEQKNFEHMIRNANEHHRPELLPLKEALQGEYFSLRFSSYDRGILGTIFDIHHFLYEARKLKWKEAEKPYLVS